MASSTQALRVVAAPAAATTLAPTAAPMWGDVWETHGGSAYALACALLGNEAAATEAVRAAMADLARSDAVVSPEEARRLLAGLVYRRSGSVGAGPLPGSGRLPRVIEWVSRMARLQRASLALCVYGGLTYREAAALLDVPPAAVADLITAGLRELGRLAADQTSSCA